MNWAALTPSLPPTPPTTTGFDTNINLLNQEHRSLPQLLIPAPGIPLSCKEAERDKIRVCLRSIFPLALILGLYHS